MDQVIKIPLAAMTKRIKSVGQAPAGTITDHKILQFLNDSLSPNNDEVWSFSKGFYNLNRNDPLKTLIFSISENQFKNSKLSDDDVQRYVKLISKKR